MVKRGLIIAVVLMVCTSLLAGCWEIGVQVTPDGGDLCNGPLLLTASAEISGNYQWYLNGQPISGAQSCQYTAAEPGLYYVELTALTSTFGSNPVVVWPCQSCDRADVSAVIYGGWDGIPVKAWVGGSEQETLYTARDAQGEAAVQWTFYPPENANWPLQVAPQVPAGFDAARWQYKLVRIESPVLGTKVVDPPSAQLSVGRCSQYVLYYQLIDTTASGGALIASAPLGPWVQLHPVSRADVSVVIYGGWDGIPVKAWVGGTEQPTMTTARDGRGEAAVLWTLQSDVARSWEVQVAPQTPPGKDPARWQYKLVRIEAPSSGMDLVWPANAQVTAGAGAQCVFYFQLVDGGAQ